MLRPVILAGGSGTRLWPLSREHYPKQFLPLVGETTMFQQTVRRITPLGSRLDDLADPLIVCNEDHRFLVSEQLSEIGASAAALILEPVGRNTAPALTLAALWAEARGEDHVLAAMPADQYIPDQIAFESAVREGYALALEGRFVTFGVRPTAPSTGYGYIRVGTAKVGSIPGGQAVTMERFIEKPAIETAKQYLATERYLWNSGIFLTRASAWISKLQIHRPDILAACRRAHMAAEADGPFLRPGGEEFESCPADSIDYAVAEKLEATASDAVVVPLEAGWSDVGTWDAVREQIDTDAEGNVVQGDVLAHDVEECTLMAQNRLVAAVGLRNLLVVETPDAVLVAARDRDQEVREVASSLREAGRPEQFDPLRVHRPWGSYQVICQGQGFQVKLLSVKPGASLSLQRHRHRSEHWVVVSGTAAVVRGEDRFTLEENQSTYVPQGTRHRLSNPGDIVLEIVEVQTGNYLGEDDIERFEDDYHRA